jgi:WD40 repeat protein
VEEDADRRSKEYRKPLSVAGIVFVVVIRGSQRKVLAPLGAKEKFMKWSMSIILGLLSIGLTVQAEDAPRCEVVFGDGSAVVTELARLRVDSEMAPDAFVRRTLMADYQRKLRGAQRAQVDVSALPQLVMEARRKNQQVRDTENKRVEETRRVEKGLVDSWTLWKGHSGFVNKVVIDGTGKKVASYADDGFILVRDTETGEVLQKHKAPVDTTYKTLTWTPDNEALVISAYDLKLLSTWDLKTQTMTTAQLPTDIPLHVAMLGSSGRLAVFSYPALDIVDLKTRKTVKTFEKLGDSSGLQKNSRGLEGMRVTADGKKIFLNFVDPGRVIVLDIDTGEHKVLMASEKSRIEMDVSADGEKLIVGDSTGELRIFDVATQSVLNRVQIANEDAELRQLHLSADGSRFVALFSNEVTWWDTATGDRLAKLQRYDFEKDPLYQAAISPDGRLVFLGSALGTIVRWEKEK